VSLPLRGLPEARVARAILRVVGGSLRAERGRATVVEPTGDASRPGEWSLATTGDSRVRLTTPLLEGAAGLACLQAVVRALRAEGACGDGGLCVHLNAADLTARGLETLVALVARQLPLVYVAAGVEPPASPPLGPGVLRRLESRRTRLARQKDAARWAGADRAGRAALGIDLDSWA